MKLKVFPHNMVSRGSRDLSNEIGGVRLREQGSPLRFTSNTLVVNWGRSSFPREIGSPVVLNRPENVAQAVNKQNAFDILNRAGIPCPINYPYEPSRLVDHINVRGTGGEGLVVRKASDPVTEGTVMTVAYIPKEQEYRVHVFQGEVIDLQRKAVREGEEPNWEVRNLKNGFVFVRGEMKWADDQTEDKVMTAAVNAVDALGLDFGAVDVVVSSRRNAPFVLEVNTAPGLEGTTLKNYSEAILNYARLLEV